MWKASSTNYSTWRIGDFIALYCDAKNTFGCCLECLLEKCKKLKAFSINICPHLLKCKSCTALNCPHHYDFTGFPKENCRRCAKGNFSLGQVAAYSTELRLVVKNNWDLITQCEVEDSIFKWGVGFETCQPCVVCEGEGIFNSQGVILNDEYVQVFERPYFKCKNCASECAY